MFSEQKGRRNYEILYLKEFRRDQIEALVEKHYDGDAMKARDTLRRMAGIYNLWDLSRRPVMLETIVKVWPRLKLLGKDAEITPAVLDREYTEQWLSSVAKGNEDLLDKGAKRGFCKNLAAWMHRQNKDVLPYSELEAVVRQYFAGRPPAAYAALDAEGADMYLSQSGLDRQLPICTSLVHGVPSGAGMC